MRFIQSSESPPWNHPLNLGESQLQLHNEIMNPFLAYHLRDHLESSKANMMTSAISETATTVDGYLLTTTYSGLKCQGNVEAITVTPLDYCYNITSKINNFYRSTKYSYASTTSNLTTTLYKDDKCMDLDGSSYNFNYLTKCTFGQRRSYVYSSTNSLPALPAEPYLRTA